ncbi:hypothetical protein KSF_104460 [Reticulibacter mediterranei]|uniref:Uncharacterized protein n=1 Tax=Reticulibacter mediterranei TaxID=2778369 RepID=A0A8J3ITS2_9CHLR|nr:hypothetical protein KSF_104460 [Reticulibacter mediterranei]
MIDEEISLRIPWARTLAANGSVDEDALDSAFKILLSDQIWGLS